MSGNKKNHITKYLLIIVTFLIIVITGLLFSSSNLNKKHDTTIELNKELSEENINFIKNNIENAKNSKESKPETKPSFDILEIKNPVEQEEQKNEIMKELSVCEQELPNLKNSFKTLYFLRYLTQLGSHNYDGHHVFTVYRPYETAISVKETSKFFNAEPYDFGYVLKPENTQCKFGSEVDENINYLYCKGMRKAEQIINSDGVIKRKAENYSINLVINPKYGLDVQTLQGFAEKGIVRESNQPFSSQSLEDNESYTYIDDFIKDNALENARYYLIQEAQVIDMEC